MSPTSLETPAADGLPELPNSPPQSLQEVSKASEIESRLPDLFTRRLYFRGLGIVYLIAILSLWSQIHGLIGEHGLLPAQSFFSVVYEKLGKSGYWIVPSLMWLSATDAMLHLLCAAGVLLSVGLIVGIAPRLVLASLWVVYLSLCGAGQDFLSFQWDTLLLEMTLCSLLYAPRGILPDWQAATRPSSASRWVLWGLAFKLMFLSGVTKLLSGDSSWSDGTALKFHYFTQPIPSWVSWYAYQLPAGVHQLSLFVMFVIEVLLPFLIFAGIWARCAFGLSSIGLMLLIEFTGNFGFFNLQTAVLCIPLLNDRLWHWMFPRKFERQSPAPETMVRPRWRIELSWCVAASILFISLLTMVQEMVRTQDHAKMPSAVKNTLWAADVGLLSWTKGPLLEPLSRFRTINGYGLFRVMTTHRPEIVVEISDDGATWTACEFPYKVGDVDRAPPIVAPQMPRLDWQMWFAGLNPRGSGAWLLSLMQGILHGNAATVRLLGHPELAANPPKFVRLSYYEYKFSSPEQKQNTGAWWSRSHTGYLTGPVSRQSQKQ